MLHVLQPAHDLHVFVAGHDRVRGLIERLQTAAAQSIDGRAPGRGADAGHQRDVPGDVQALLLGLLRVAQHDVFDGVGRDAGALRSTLRRRPRPDRRSRVSRKVAALGMSSPDGRADTINDDSGVHATSLLVRLTSIRSILPVNATRRSRG